MKIILFLFISVTFSITSIAKNLIIERADWGKYFTAFDAKGTIVVLDTREKIPKQYVFNNKRANTRYSPASTYKIPHTLFALDADVIKDEFQVFKWDGVKRSYSKHNQDQTLRSAMRYSAVWVYDLLAKELGEDKANNYLHKIQYGNENASSKNLSTKSGSYWIDGELSISAVEQINFLQRFYENKLPFSLAHQLLVKKMMISDKGDDWLIRAKTGWQGQYGWWVGWVEKPTGPVYFALNIDTPNRLKDLYKRQTIVREVLKSIHVL
jgi:beta-lactamase class D